MPISDDMKVKVEKLPVWAREYIHRLVLQSEPNIEEIAKLRHEVESLNKLKRKLTDRIEAMVQMFQCAAKGENDVAKAVMNIVEEYILCGTE